MQLFGGETAAAIKSYEAAVDVFERVGEQAAAQTAMFQLATAQTYEGAQEDALATCGRVLDLSAERGEQWCRAYSLWVTGICQWRRGRVPHHRRRPSRHSACSELSRTGSALRSRSLGSAVAERLRSAQANLGKLDVVELGLGERTATPGSQQQSSPLTPRESEVAKLIAEGLSNRAIADRLVISHRTVDGHVERVLAKLEFTSRAQVAIWATAQVASS